ncbi:MAG TPA: hypothetical protein VFG38_12600 [Pseudomonadales bacterium]|nr:hypothetical protein [Pseudomonadales bacterium]
MNVRSTRFLKHLAGAAVLASAIGVAPVAIAGGDDFRIESWQGSVQSLDVTNNSIIVGGVMYDVAPDARVQLGGSYGAFTLMTPGMNVKIMIKRYIDTGRREIIDIEELPPGVVPQQY